MKTLKYLVLLIFFTGIPLISTFAQEIPEPPDEIAPMEHYMHQFELSKETEQEYLKKIDASLKQDLLEMKKFDKEKYFELLMESEYSFITYPHLDREEKMIYERSRDISDLEVRTEIMAFKYERASASEKQSIKTELRKKLSELFELREIDRQYQISMLEKEIKELKASIGMRKKNKELIISRRLQELLGEDKYLDWD